jgi:multiple sugar transport system ATP-binding protein
MAEVRLERVYKTYKGEVEAVIDLNLTIQDGEFLALLGPSGCGKTSTLRMIVGLEPITDGEIYIGDRLVNKLEPKDRDVALAFETYALYPPLSVRDNITSCLRAKRVPATEINRRLEGVARLLDITDILDRKPGELGGGQKQRVSLARALIRQPAVFLMDEPLSHLDARLRAHMRKELKRLHGEIRTTTVLVTHDQLEAIAMAQRIAVMNLGELQQVGTADALYNQPANEFVAGFVGEPPINLMLCQVISEGDKTYVYSAEGGFRLALPSAIRQRVLAKQPKKVNLGIRPLNIEFSKTSRNGDGLEMEGTVWTFEDLGEEGQLSVKVGEHIILVVTPPEVDVQIDEKVWLHFTPERIHLFDSETTVAI